MRCKENDLIIKIKSNSSCFSFRATHIPLAWLRTCSSSVCPVMVCICSSLPIRFTLFIRPPPSWYRTVSDLCALYYCLVHLLGMHQKESTTALFPFFSFFLPPLSHCDAVFEWLAQVALFHSVSFKCIHGFAMKLASCARECMCASITLRWMDGWRTG